VTLEDALSAIPLFPLPHVVLFPEAVLPLHVFEPRYRKMLADCLASHRALAVTQILAGEDEWGQPNIATVAGGGVIVEHQPLPDGRSNIVVVGKARLRLEEIPPDPASPLPYRRARATILEDVRTSVPPTDRTALVAAATMFASEVKKHDPLFTFRLPASPDAGQLADMCAYQLVVDASARQAILEALDPKERVEMVLSQLALQQGAMRKAADDAGSLN
jgi:ATP-dependent Lon protease